MFVAFMTSPAWSDTLINFDNLTVGEPVTTISGVGFSFLNLYNDGAGLVVVSGPETLDHNYWGGYDTTSPPNYLGVNRYDENFSFSLGEDITLTFSPSLGPVTGISVAFIAHELQDPEFTIDAGSLGYVSTNSGTKLPGDNWSTAYTVTFTSATPLSSVTLEGRYVNPDASGFSYNIDDISLTNHATVPEPPTLIFLFLALVAASFAGKSGFFQRNRLQ
jgi:hypothetical protein